MLDRFLSRDAAERDRLLDLALRLRPAYALAVLVMAVPVVLGIHVFGAAAAAPLVLAAMIHAGLSLHMPHARQPERHLLASCAIGVVACLAAIGLANGPKEYLFAMPVVPMLGMAPVFAKRVSIAAGALTSAGIVAVGFATYGDQVRAMPPMLILPVLLVMVIVLGSIASRNAEHVNRGTAMVDPLTGLLNRVALQSRATELQLHAAASADRVGLILCELDPFRIARPATEPQDDGVLTEVADRLRTELGSAGTIFRFGGEEFVVLLQSATPCTALEWAQRLREAIRFAPVDGVDVTASFGVAVSRPETGFELRSLFVEADGALLQAKASGRDRVFGASEPGGQPTGPTPPAATAGRERATAFPGAYRATDVSPSADATLGGVDPAGAPWDLRIPADAKNEGNWLVADAVERAHVIDLLQRSAADSRLNSVLALGALVASGFWLGWWMLVPPVVAAVFWRVCTTRIQGARRPEFAALAGLVLIATAAPVGATLATQDALFALPLAALAVLGACAGFHRTGAVLIAAVGMVATVVAAFVIDAGAVVATPVVVAFPLALVAVNALLGAAMGRAAREHRVAAITDPLTGSLNRAALDARVPQLAQHAATGGPIALAVVDIDHLHRVTELHGSAVGDAVLAGVSARLRGTLRAFDSVYRLGGETLVVVLTGIAESDARDIAERARQAVRREPIEGIAATVCIGVATAPAGEPLDFDAVLALAESRLREAKRGGHDRVVDGAPSLPERRLMAA